MISGFVCYKSKQLDYRFPIFDDFVKSPSAALRFNFVVVAHR
jgi:hypothetical protein